MRQPAWEPKSKRPPHSHPAGVRRVGVWVHADWLSGIAHWLKRHARMAQVQRTSCFSSASSNSFFSFAFCMNFMPKTRPLRAGLDMAEDTTGLIGPVNKGRRHKVGQRGSPCGRVYGQSGGVDTGPFFRKSASCSVVCIMSSSVRRLAQQVPQLTKGFSSTSSANAAKNSIKPYSHESVTLGKSS